MCYVVIQYGRYVMHLCNYIMSYKCKAFMMSTCIMYQYHALYSYTIWSMCRGTYVMHL